MPIKPPDPHTAKFLQAINEFVESSPNQLSDEIKGALKGVGQTIAGYTAQDQSPGEKQAAKAYTDGTGVSYKKAAQGEDQPSPGQREFQQAIDGIREQAVPSR